MNFSTRRPRGRRETRFGFGWDSLESRQLLTINFQIDYTYDTNNFFSTSERRNALQAAANTLGSILNDTLLGITPGGGNTWSLNFDHPGNNSTVTLNNQTIPLNTLRIYAGGRNIGGGTIGLGGPGGYNASGDESFLALVGARGQVGALNQNAPTDIGPWGGSITFDTGTNWYFGLDAANIGNRTDFYTTALHELTHLIGFGTSGSWETLISAGRFAGTAATARFGTTVSISPDQGHWREGTMDGNYEVSMDPSQTNGERKLISGLDVAGLDDIGWDIKVGANATAATAINATVPASGSRSFVAQSIATVTDVRVYRLTLTAGQSLTASVTSLTPSLDTLVRLFDASGTEIASANNAASGVDTLTRTIGLGGTYYLGVSSSTNSRYLPADGTNQLMAGATGSFNLTIGLPGGNGGGATGDTVGVFNPANAGVYLRNANSPGTPDIAPFVFGNGSFKAIVGDWNGDSIDTVGVFNPANAVFYLRNANSSGSPDIAPFQFGATNWIPIAGDWDGDGTTTIGVYNPATSVFYLRNTNSSGGVDYAPIQFGAPGFLPVVGDWDGNGTSTIGVYNPANSAFYLRNSNSPGAPDAGLFGFGAPNWRPVSGDFDNNGTTTIGVYNPTAGAFYLRNSNSSGAPDAGQFAYGGANWQPLFGRFAASGTSSARAVTSAASPAVSSLSDNAGLFALETNPALKLTSRKASRVSEQSVSELARDLLKDLATPAHQSV